MNTTLLRISSILVLVAAVSSAAAHPVPTLYTLLPSEPAPHIPPIRPSFDLVVYGASPAGIASAISAADHGRSVALIEPTRRIGGMMTSGLSYTDFLSLESLGGIFRDYMRRVEHHYVQTYGAGSPPHRDCFFGAHAEPHVTLQVFRQMLAERPGIAVFTLARLDDVETRLDAQGRTTITAARFAGRGVSFTLNAAAFIDATYEGDLAVDAGALSRVGRESTRQHGERLAGRLYYRGGKILPGSTGEADVSVQCYNFRITMTDVPENRVDVPMPPGYDRAEFLDVLDHIRSGRIKKPFTEKTDGILRIQRIPRGKADINDIPGALVRLSLPGENDAYPDGDHAVRARISERHRRYNLGLIYFLQNDAQVPQAMRDEARRWGLCRDEFIEDGHFPPLLYVREARRIMGEYLFTEHDALMGVNTLRTPLHTDAIAIGDYPLNCHGNHKAGPLHLDVTEGEFGYRTQPFQVPYGVIVPRGLTNLLVPVCCSATHVGYSCLRLEPVYVALGEAAGIAAHLAINKRIDMADVDVPTLQRLLHRRGARTIYVSDVEADHPPFGAVQYFGTRGAFHHLHDPTATTLPAQKFRYGLQYFDAYPLHAAELDKPIDRDLAWRWIALLPTDAAQRQAASDPAMPPDGKLTRGRWLGRLYDLVGHHERGHGSRGAGR